MNQITLSEKSILTICNRLWQRNLLAAADGNVSVRTAKGTMLITPAGLHKAFLTEEDLAEVRINDGAIVRGTPSSERAMHLEIYQRCANANAVIHAHPPTVIAWTIAHPHLTALPEDCMSELILAAGTIPIIPYQRPGSNAMGLALFPAATTHRALVLARHGALTWGESLDEAYRGMERLEHAAQILKSAHELGGLTKLPHDEVAALRAMRRNIGDQLL